MRQGTREYNETIIRVIEDDPGGNAEKIERLKNIGSLDIIYHAIDKLTESIVR